MGKFSLQDRILFMIILRFILSLCFSLILLSPVVVLAADNTNPQQPSIIRYESIHHPVVGQSGMVVTQNEIATQIGLDILEQGGNAVDSAVAVGFALAVTLPRAGNLGGSGYMLLYLNELNETISLDFRSVAPAAARLEDFLNEEGEIDYDPLTYGPKAAAVPGTVAGLYAAWERYGLMDWQDILQPAIDLATKGITVTPDLAYALEQAVPVMSAYPSSIEIYTKENSDFYQPNEIFVQKDLAWSLQQISEHGADAFYKGAIAEKITEFMKSENAYISADDLANYKVRDRAPISTIYRDHRVVSMPPSSTGGLALLQMLNVLSEFDLSAMPQGSADSIHIIAEVMKRVNANRRQGIGDMDFVHVPIAGMLSDSLATDIASDINLSQATSVNDIEGKDALHYESPDTTHYSIVDKEGNGVSLTYTLGYSFGSGLVVPGTGILLDNQMRNFYHREPEHANAMLPGKRMISTMAPTLVFDKDNNLRIVTGTPGGSRIHTSILQVLINVIDYGLNIAEATHRPRIYQGWRSAELGLEQGISSNAAEILANMGHEIEIQQTMGSTQSIMIINEILYGSADPRRPGALALGLD